MKFRVIGVIAALLLALVGGVLILSYAQGADQRAMAGMRTEDILVVSKAVPAGTDVAALAQDLTVKKIPASAVADGALSVLTGVTNQVTSVDLVPGEQLLRSRLVSPSSAQTTGGVKVPRGMQEVTIPLTPEKALGGLLKPGDTVGIFVSFSTPAPETHLTLQKVLVTKVQGGASPPAASSTPAPSNGAAAASATVPSGGMLITFALRAPDAEKVVYATQFGAVWLSDEPSTADETGTDVVRQGSLY
jgi:pilus assembly protein CpaB